MYRTDQKTSLTHLFWMNSFGLTIFKELFYRVDNSLKSLRIVHSKVCKNFTVETDVLLRKATHELGVSESVLTGGGVDTLYPQGAEFALLGLSVTVCIGETFLIGVLCNRPDVLAGEEITAGPAEDLLAACPGGNRIN